MSEAIRYQPRYTADNYRSWDGEWELWDGVAVNMSPSPTFDLQAIATSLAAELRSQVRNGDGCHCTVVTELDWQIGDATVVRPDVSVLCEGHPGQFISYPPTVIAEILSPSTEHKDRTAKRDLYEQQGVRFYLLIDPKKKSIEILSLNEVGKYQATPKTDQSLSLQWDEDCRVEISVDAVFSF